MLNYGSTGDGFVKIYMSLSVNSRVFTRKQRGQCTWQPLFFFFLILCDTEEGLYKILDEKTPFKMHLLCSDSFSVPSAYLKVFLTLSTLLAFKQTFAPSPVLTQSYRTCIQKCLLVVTITISVKTCKAKQSQKIYIFFSDLPSSGAWWALLAAPVSEPRMTVDRKLFQAWKTALLLCHFCTGFFFFFLPSP